MATQNTSKHPVDEYPTGESFMRGILEDWQAKGLLPPTPEVDRQCFQCHKSAMICSGTDPCFECVIDRQKPDECKYVGHLNPPVEAQAMPPENLEIREAIARARRDAQRREAELAEKKGGSSREEWYPACRPSQAELDRVQREYDDYLARAAAAEQQASPGSKKP